MNIKEEEKKIADTAAGQKEYIRQTFPDKALDPTNPEKYKMQIVRICVTAYIDEALAEKTRLLKRIEVEQAKNRDIKDFAEQLALELERLSPGHQLASDVLALLLEHKMKGGKSDYVRRKNK